MSIVILVENKILSPFQHFLSILSNILSLVYVLFVHLCSFYTIFRKYKHLVMQTKSFIFYTEPGIMVLNVTFSCCRWFAFGSPPDPIAHWPKIALRFKLNWKLSWWRAQGNTAEAISFPSAGASGRLVLRGFGTVVLIVVYGQKLKSISSLQPVVPSL